VLVLLNLIAIMRRRSRKKRLLADMNLVNVSELPVRNGNDVASWRRVLGAVETAFKVTMFRRTIPIGRNHELSIAELLVSAAYTAVLYAWSFMNS
jgi:hypothetical protein